MRRAFFALIVLGLLLLTLPTAGAARDGKKIPRGKTVVVQAAEWTPTLSWTWDPPEITIRTGGRVRWENPTEVDHSVQPWVEEGASSQPWASESQLEPGGSVEFRFTEPGVYTYRCGVSLHSDIVYLVDNGRCVGMCGTITVE